MRKRKRMKIIKKVLLHKINGMNELNRYPRQRIEKDIFLYKPKNIYFKLVTANKSTCSMCCMEKYCNAYFEDEKTDYMNCACEDSFKELSEIEVLVLTGG